MLLKVYVEDTLPFLQAGNKGNTLVKWIVNDNLPLSHPQQLAALATALNLTPEEQQQVDPRNFTIMYGSDAVDPTLTPAGAMLVSGTVLTMAAKSTTPRTMRQISVVAGTPRSHSRNPYNTSADEDAPHTPRSVSRYGGADTDTNASPSECPDADETMSVGYDRDEVYVSEECGWFPFHLSSNYGQLPIAVCIDPQQVPKETDRNPPQQQLCAPCSQLLGDSKSLSIPVDRHYKPMSLNYEVSEGWVEKLSLGRFARWQKRYLMLTEKSVDWFQDQPVAGEKPKIKGTRHVMRDGVVNIVDIIESPDPSANPKCKDTNYFHFGIVFRHPSTTMYFRVPSLQQRVKYITFLKQMVTRLGNTGAQRDPVYWKKWSDAFLTNIADLGEVTAANTQEHEALLQELATTELRRQEIRDELPGLNQVMHQHRQTVQALKKELANVDVAMAEAERAAKKEEAAIEGERIELGLVEIEIGDELRKAEVLRAYVRNEKETASNRIFELENSIAQLKKKHQEMFERWRKLEEKSSSQSQSGAQRRGGSTYLSPSSTLGRPTSSMLSFSPSGIPLAQSVKKLPEGWSTPPRKH